MSLLFPAEVRSDDGIKVLAMDQWVLLEEGRLHLWDKAADNYGVIETASWPATLVDTDSGPTGPIHVYEINHPEHGIIQVTAKKTGGCGCSDPRKPVGNLEQMKALHLARAAKSRRQTDSDKSKAERLAIAQEKARLRKAKNKETREKNRILRGGKPKK